jgi:hypothetical protein
MKNEKLITLTEQLLLLTNRMVEQFQQTKATGIQSDFYQEVMPFFNDVQSVLNEWWSEVTTWVEAHEKIHFNQVLNTKEQIEKAAIQAFYPQTSRKNFLNMIKAIVFLLNSIIQDKSVEIEGFDS